VLSGSWWLRGGSWRLVLLRCRAFSSLGFFLRARLVVHTASRKGIFGIREDGRRRGVGIQHR